MADEIFADFSKLTCDGISGLEAAIGNNMFQAPGVSSMLEVDLGWANSLMFQQDCPLCVALLNSMPHYVYSRDAYIVLCSIDSRNRYIHEFSRSLKAEGESRCLFALLNNDPEMDEATWAYMDLGRIADALDAIQLVGPTLNKKSTVFGGRVVRHSGIDFELVRSWVSRCMDHHNETCRPQRSDVLGRIRVIDVIERRLVTYIEAGCPEYVALSYVWGLDAQPEFPGTSTISHLPATLEDSMEFVRILGTRYIWIDSICINQQDAQDKEAQVQIMDAIYTGAWLTVVAISSDSMNSGIRRVEGVNKGPVQLRCHFGDDILVSVGETLRQQVSRSRWGTRAWTYQEALLSPRCLFIANEQLYFECNSANSCDTVEDASSPYHSLNTGRYIAHMQAGANSLNFRIPFIKTEKERDWDEFEDWSDALYAETPGQYLDHYVRQLKQYSQRKMTGDMDSLNAFGGTLKRLELSWFPQGFFQGVPIEHLSTCLMWEHSGQRRRREGFPTWSWAGWEGTLSRVHCFDEQSHIFQAEKNEWQRPLFKAYRAVRGQLELIFASSSIESAHKAWCYTSMCLQEQLAEFSRFAESTPPGYDKALPELRRMLISKPNLTQKELDTPLDEIFPDLAGWTIPEALSSQSIARESYFDRTQLPYDPFWVLAQDPCSNNDYSPSYLDEDECTNRLFLDCLTVTLQIDIESPRLVNIMGIECDLRWFSKAPKDQLVKNSGQSDFIVIARDSGILQLLMVGISGKIATRVAPVTLWIPTKAALEKLLQDEERVTKTRLLLQGLEGWNRREGKETWENDDFHGILIANGAHPRRRRLILA
ncbi:Nn.00g117600.m01.CDS01 [Neocucurbitaria sp. VM-36]